MQIRMGAPVWRHLFVPDIQRGDFRCRLDPQRQTSIADTTGHHQLRIALPVMPIGKPRAETRRRQGPQGAQTVRPLPR